MQDKYEATTTPTPSQETLPQGVPENSFLEIQKIKEKRKRLIIISIAVFAGVLILGGALVYLITATFNKKPKEIVLTMWGIRQPQSVYSSVINQYEKSHPGVKINYIQVPSKNYESTLFQTLQKGGNTPDIVTIGNTYLPIFQKYLYPAPSNIININTFKSIFYPTAFQDLTSNGNIYALPSNYDGLSLIYNKTEFAKAGLSAPSSNINTFVSQIPKLVVKDSNGNVTQAAIDIGKSTGNINNAYNILTYLMFINNTQMIGGNQVTFANGPQAQEALNLYYQIAQTDGWSATFPNSVSAFAGGSVAMILEPSWEIQNIFILNPNINIGVMAPPQIPGQNVNLSLYFAKAVVKYSQYPQVAWNFLNYLDSQSTLTTLYNNEIKNKEVLGEVFPRTDMANLATNYKYMEPFVQMAPTSKSWEMGDYKFVDNVFNSVIEGNISLSQAQNQIFKTLASIINGVYIVPPNE